MIDKELVADKLAQGIKPGVIAKALGCHRNTIGDIKKRPDVQKRILEETERLLDTLPDITGQIARDIKFADKLSKVLSGEAEIGSLGKVVAGFEGKELVKLQELAYKKHQDILKTAGIYPSGTPSIFVQQFIQNNTANIIQPAVMELLGKHLSGMFAEEEEVIDIEAVDKEDG